MSLSFHSEIRVLAIDPCTRGFGFAVLEGPSQLIDWGVRQAGGNKNPQALQEIERLIDFYRPEVVVLENPSGKGSRRYPRIEELIRNILTMGLGQRIRCCQFSRDSVREAFASRGGWTKHQIALAIGKQFPELAERVPPVRKCWMPEHHSMAIFDAVSFALTFFHNSQQQAA